jgi:hypothetical protein
MDHPTRLMEVDQSAAGPFKVRAARIAIDFFDALQQPLVAGRGFDSRDLHENARTVIVNTTFARRAFGSINPIGKRMRQGRRADGCARADPVAGRRHVPAAGEG